MRKVGGEEVIGDFGEPKLPPLSFIPSIFSPHSLHFFFVLRAADLHDDNAGPDCRDFSSVFGIDEGLSPSLKSLAIFCVLTCTTHSDTHTIHVLLNQKIGDDRCSTGSYRYFTGSCRYSTVSFLCVAVYNTFRYTQGSCFIEPKNW